MRACSEHEGAILRNKVRRRGPEGFHSLQLLLAPSFLTIPFGVFAPAAGNYIAAAKGSAGTGTGTNERKDRIPDRRAIFILLATAFGDDSYRSDREPMCLCGRR